MPVARQHAAGAELPVERLDVGDDEAARVGRTHPDRVAFAIGRRPARGLFWIDPLCFGVKESWRKIVIEVGLDLVGIHDDFVAHAEGTLGGFDDAVDVLETFSPSATRRRSNSARMISEARPCVGGGVL